MNGGLARLVNDEDALSGINKLIDTMKKQHVMNFAMNQELMEAVHTKMTIENWQSQILERTKTSSAPLAKEN